MILKWAKESFQGFETVLLIQKHATMKEIPDMKSNPKAVDIGAFSFNATIQPHTNRKAATMIHPHPFSAFSVDVSPPELSLTAQGIGEVASDTGSFCKSWFVMRSVPMCVVKSMEIEKECDCYPHYMFPYHLATDT
jgi:hypothetical protein